MKIKSSPVLVSDLAVVSTFFSFANFAAPQANLRRFIRHMRLLGVALFGVELVLPGQVAATKGVDGWQQIEVTDRAILWQKEALINERVRSLPKRFTKVAWVDADISFSDPDWALLVSRALDNHPVLQPFEQCSWLGRDGAEEARKQSFVKSGTWQKRHPGFAMAARRSFFEVAGLYPWSVIGSGDSVLAVTLTESNAVQTLLNVGDGVGHGLAMPEVRDLYERWADAARAYAQLDQGLAYLEGVQAYHDWHGSYKNRRYKDRMKLIADLDVNKELKIAHFGGLEWTEHAKPDRVQAIREYFLSRREDG